MFKCLDTVNQCNAKLFVLFSFSAILLSIQILARIAFRKLTTPDRNRRILQLSSHLRYSPQRFDKHGSTKACINPSSH